MLLTNSPLIYLELACKKNGWYSPYLVEFDIDIRKKVCTTLKKIIAIQKYTPFGQNSLYLQNSCEYYLGVSVVAVRYLIWGQ